MRFRNINTTALMVVAVLVGIIALGYSLGSWRYQGTLASSSSASENAGEVLRFATVVPSTSPWGQALKVWAETVQKQSNGDLQLQFSFNGAEDDEGAMASRIKDGQLHGAFLTAVGLSKFHKPIGALEMPGLITNAAKLDAVLADMTIRTDFEKGIQDTGCTILGWTEIGMSHVMSKGFHVSAPTDIRGKKPYMWRDDPVQPILYQVIGGITPIPLNTPQVLSNLNTGAVNIVIAPSLLAEQLGWASKLDHIDTAVAGASVGAIVISSKRLDALSEKNRNIILMTGRVASNGLTKEIRIEDDAAFTRLIGKMTAVTQSKSEQNQWLDTYDTTWNRLAQGTFPPDIVSRLIMLSK